jgi:hypothetical protein
MILPAASIHFRVTIRTIPRDCAGFGFVYEAHPAVHIEMRVGGCQAADDPKDKQDMELFLAEALTPWMRPTATAPANCAIESF